MPEITEEQLATYQSLEKKLESANAEAAAHRKARNEAREELSTVQKTVAELQAAVEKPNADWKAKEAELTAALTKAREHGEQAEARYKSKVVDEAISSAAIKAGAIDPSVVAKLVRDGVSLDDKGGLVVKSGEGVMTNDKGDRVSVEDYVSGFLTKNPYLVKAGPGGSGSEGGSKDKTGAKEMKRGDFEALDPGARSKAIKEGIAIVD